MARMTITFSDSLREQIDNVGEKVNWSNVAAKAFENKVIEIKSKKRNIDMETVVQRLMASKEVHAKSREQLGFDSGLDFAKRFAKFEHLENLNNTINEMGNDSYAIYNESDAYSPAEKVAFAALGLGNGDEDRQASESFWELALGYDQKNADDPAFVEGFVEGALELFSQVQSKL